MTNRSPIAHLVVSQDARDKLVRLAYRFVWNKDDAEDAVQDSLALAHSRGVQLHEREKWWGWLQRIVINRCHSIGRANVRRRTRQASAADARRGISGEAGLHDESGDDKECVRAALLELPRRQREVIVLRFLEGQSYEQIADVLEISTSTARVHARAGLESMRAALPSSEALRVRPTEGRS